MVTVSGVVPAGVAGMRPAEGGGPAEPPGAESRVSWSMFQPVDVWWPRAVSMTCAPAPSVIPPTELPQGTIESCRRRTASIVEPEIARSIGRPSIDSRSDRQVEGTSAGNGPT